MPVPVMNIGHVIVLMFLGGMFVFMRMDAIHLVVSVCRISAFVTVLVE